MRRLRYLVIILAFVFECVYATTLKSSAATPSTATGCAQSAQANGGGCPQTAPGPEPSGGPLADGTACITTGTPWAMPGEFWSGDCKAQSGLLIKAADDKYGGDGLNFATINQFESLAQDDSANGPFYATTIGDQASAHSFYDCHRHTVGTGCSSLVYNNARIMIDNKNLLGGNIGGTGICGTNDVRDTEYLTYIASFGTAHLESTTTPVTTNDVLHAIGISAPNSIISTSNIDGGRQTGTAGTCGSVTAVQNWAMNIGSTDIINLTKDHFAGVIGNTGTTTFVTGMAGYWHSSTPAPNTSNPNGDTNNAMPNFDTTKVGSFSCYDIMYSDVAGPFYGSGQGNGGLGGGPWDNSYELDPITTVGGVWDWTPSQPGILKSDITWAASLFKPVGAHSSRCDDGTKWKVWFNGASQNGVVVADDTNHVWSGDESCNADAYGGNALGSNQGTTDNVVGASLENSWISYNTNYWQPPKWTINTNCVSDVWAESTNIFAEIGGHSSLFDTSYDGTDMVAVTTAAITNSSSAQTVTATGANIQGASLGTSNSVPLIVIDPVNGNEIVSNAGVSGTTSIKAIFLLNHPIGTKIQTLSPESNRIIFAALDYFNEEDGKTSTQDSYWNTGQGNAFTNHFDVGHYLEEDFHGTWLKTAAKFVGNPVYTTLTTQVNAGGNILIFQPDSGVSDLSCTSACWNGTRDMFVGQHLNLFDPGATPHVETVTVQTIDSSTQIHVATGVTFTHASGAILRGTQAADGCQRFSSTQFALDQSTIGGSPDYLLGLSTPCGDNGLQGTSRIPAGKAYCREAIQGTLFATGPLFNWAVCMNLTNAAVPINTLYAAGGCSGYCLTNNYRHFCGALVLNGHGVDDGCLGRNPPVNTTGTLNISTTSNTAVTTTGLHTITPASMTGIVNGATIVYDPTGTNPETLVISGVTGSTFQATFAFTHLTGVAIEGVIFTPGSMNGVKVGGLYLMDSPPILETVCVVSVTGSTAVFGTSVSGGSCQPGDFDQIHTGTMNLTSSSATVQLDTNYDGGGGTVCGYGGPYNVAGHNPNPAPQTSFSVNNCPSLTTISNADSTDALAPFTPMIFLQ